MFEPIQKGNYGLTDEAIYKSIQYDAGFIPVFGGEQEHTVERRWVSEAGRTKKDTPVKIFSGEGVIISLDGSAGHMTHVLGKRFALNHHAGFFIRKTDAEDIILYDFFCLFYEKQLKSAGVSEGSKTLSLETIYMQEFDVPNINVQKIIMSKIQPILIKKYDLNHILEKIHSLKDRVLSHDYDIYQAKDVPIRIILDCMSGNSGLTESEIYQKITLDGERYTVLSSSTREENMLGEIPKCQIKGKILKLFEDKDGILVIRKGRAGETFFLKEGKYTINDDAYILYRKEDCKYDISLKWVIAQYNKTFFEYSSSSDNGTWNKTRFFKNVNIDIPSYDEQVCVANLYDELEDIEAQINVINKNINDIFTKQIASN